MTKKHWTGILAAAMTASLALTGCGGGKGAQTAQKAEVKKTTADSYPLQTDQTLRYWLTISGHVSAHSQSLNDTPLAQDLKDKTGINVEFVHPAIGQETEQFNLMLASKDVPDIIEYSWNNYTGGPESAISKNTIVDLNTVLDAGVSPNLQKLFDENPDIGKACQTETGKTYIYPFVVKDGLLQTYMGPMVRADLLEKYNLSAPETLDEWENMLRVFKENGVKSPLTLRMDNVKFADMSPFIGAYGAAGTFYVEDGKVKFGPYTEEYRQFLTLMSRWYSEGLLDPNFTDTDSKRLTSVVANGEAAAAFGSAGGDFGKWIPAAQAQDPNARFVPVKYPVLHKGDTPKFGQKNLPVGGFGAAISGKSKNVELAARFLDFGYSEEGHMTYNFGKEGESYTMQDGVPTYTDIILDNDKNGGMGVGPAMGKYIRACYNGPFVQDVNYLTQFYTMPEQLEGVKTWSETDTLDYKMPLSPMTQEENKEYTKIMSDIDTYRQEVMYKTITGKSALSDLDNYYTEMKNRGIERAIELQQAAYDRYMAK